MRKAVYAGSFDPLTNGHVWMIEQGLELFDHLTVAIGTNPDKRYSFPLESRLEVLRDSLGEAENMAIAHFDNRYLVDYATEVGANYILRGIRAAQDYEYERVMRYMNQDLNPSIQTVFLMPPRELAELSSSMIKGLVGPQGWENHVSKMVPKPVFEALQAST